MTIRTQSHHPSTGAVIPSAGLEANFVELYDLQDGGIDGTNMNLAATFAWTGAHSFAANVTFDTTTMFVDATNNIVAFGAASHTVVYGNDYRVQSTATNYCFAAISTSSAAAGAIYAGWHNSSSPADNDVLTYYRAHGNSDTGVTYVGGQLTFRATDVSNGTEDVTVRVEGMKAGTLTTFADFVNEELLLGNIDPPTANRMNMNSGVKAWLSYEDGVGLLNSYNITSVTDEAAAGEWTVTWDTNFTDADGYAVAASALGLVAGGIGVSWSNQGTGSIVILTWLDDGSYYDQDFHLIAIGDQ